MTNRMESYSVRFYTLYGLYDNLILQFATPLLITVTLIDSDIARNIRLHSSPEKCFSRIQACVVLYGKD